MKKSIADLTRREVNLCLAVYAKYKAIRDWQDNDQVMVSNAKHSSYNFDPSRCWSTAGSFIASLRPQPADYAVTSDVLMSMCKECLRIIYKSDSIDWTEFEAILSKKTKRY